MEGGLAVKAPSWTCPSNSTRRSVASYAAPLTVLYEHLPTVFALQFPFMFDVCPSLQPLTFYFCHCGLTLISLDPDNSHNNTSALFCCKTVIGKYLDLRETTPRPVVPCSSDVASQSIIHLEMNKPSSSGGLQHLNSLNVPMTWLYWPYWIAISRYFDVGWFVQAAGIDPI